MPVEACLIDVYRTLVTVDFAAVNRELAAVAGVPVERLASATGLVGELAGSGRVTMADAFAALLDHCGVETRPDLVATLVAADAELLASHARLYDDALGFLHRLRHLGVRTALVSNCAPNTRPLLSHLALDGLVDSVVLSCEVGSSKPEPGIFEAALGHLGVDASDSLLVDDQADYCAGARAVGIRAVQLVRPPRHPEGNGLPAVRSLAELGDTLAAGGL